MLRLSISRLLFRAKADADRPPAGCTAGQGPRSHVARNAASSRVSATPPLGPSDAPCDRGEVLLRVCRMPAPFFSQERRVALCAWLLAGRQCHEDSTSSSASGRRRSRVARYVANRMGAGLSVAADHHDRAGSGGRCNSSVAPARTIFLPIIVVHDRVDANRNGLHHAGDRNGLHRLIRSSTLSFGTHFASTCFFN